MLKTIFRFGLIVVALLILFQLSNASFFVPSIPADVIIALTATVLIFLGIYLGSKFRKEKIVEIEPPKELNKSKIAELGISKRELEVLQLISEGLSNQEIGERLFVSESTIKTHISNLFVKLDVKRRTQAVTKAKAWRLIV